MVVNTSMHQGAGATPTLSAAGDWEDVKSEVHDPIRSRSSACNLGHCWNRRRPQWSAGDSSVQPSFSSHYRPKAPDRFGKRHILKVGGLQLFHRVGWRIVLSVRPSGHRLRNRSVTHLQDLWHVSHKSQDLPSCSWRSPYRWLVRCDYVQGEI